MFTFFCKTFVHENFPQWVIEKQEEELTLSISRDSEFTLNPLPDVISQVSYEQRWTFDESFLAGLKST